MTITPASIIITILALWFGWVNFTVLLSIPATMKIEEGIGTIISTYCFYLFTFFCMINTVIYYLGFLP